MYKQAKILLVAVFSAMSASVLATAAVTVERARQRYPWNGLFDVSYTLSGIEDNHAYVLKFMASVDGIAKEVFPQKLPHLVNHADRRFSNGTYSVIWDAAAEVSFPETVSSNCTVFALLTDLGSEGEYPAEATGSPVGVLADVMVIDITAGSSASSYPVSYYYNVDTGRFNCNNYKHSRIPLRKLSPGSVIVGDDQTAESNRVWITSPFYLGLFEMTQDQYANITGSRPSYFNDARRGVESISYDIIRGSSLGSQWPAGSDVDASSFMGVMSARTGLRCDLPSGAQWEYACRAGTTTRFSFGDTINGEYLWYNGNSDNFTHEVGVKKNNPWGFYDMHGNIQEWNLDWYGTAEKTSPVDFRGPKTGIWRILRGGSFGNADSDCSAAIHNAYVSSYTGRWYGFRMAVKLNN